MQMQIIWFAAMFLVGWMVFYLFGRQFLFDFLTAFPLIKKMQQADEKLIDGNAVKYTVVSVITTGLMCVGISAVIIWLCSTYLKIAYGIGFVLALVLFCNKLTPETRSNFDAFCAAYYRFVPDDELRTLMYNKNPHKMKVRLHAMELPADIVPSFKKENT